MAKIIKIKPQLTFFDDESARKAADEIEAIEEGADLHVVLKSYGGGLWDGWESCLSLQNFKGNSTVDVPGVSASFGIAFMVFADKRICSNQAKFMFHAVAGGSDKVNKESKKELYDIIAKVVDVVAFKEVTGKTLKEVMMPADGERVDVWLNAKEAKKVKLVDSIYDLDPSKRSAAETETIGYYKFVEYEEPTNRKDNVPRGTNINNKISKMNKEQLKTEHPALYNEICNAERSAGKTEGINAEFERAEAFREFAEIDPEAVDAKIKDKTATVDAAFLKEMRTKAKADALANAASDESEPGLNAGSPSNEPKGDAGKVSIPEDVKAEAIARAKKLGLDEKVVLEELANEYREVK